MLDCLSSRDLVYLLDLAFDNRDYGDLSE